MCAHKFLMLKCFSILYNGDILFSTYSRSYSSTLIPITKLIIVNNSNNECGAYLKRLVLFYLEEILLPSIPVLLLFNELAL